MIVWCGIKLMGGPSVAQKSEAKDCIANAIFGILLAAGSWIILNTINAQLIINELELGNTVLIPNIGPNEGRDEKVPRAPGWYFRYKDNAGITRYSGPFSQAMCNEIQAKAGSDSNMTEVTLCFEVKQDVAPIVPPANPPPEGDGAKCMMSGVNLCDPRMWRPGGTCTNSNCPAFAAAAAKNATGAATANLIKAVIWQESSCNTSAVGPTTPYGQACGPMQMLPSTANSIRSLCGITETITCTWLTSPKNTDKAICLGAKYLNKLVGSCGSNVRNIAAGYNAGPGNCGSSLSCGSDKSCDGSTVRKWECLYDDAAHKKCNSGFNETRRYATQVLYCNNKPGF
jgi:hypothetical protein